MTSPTRAPERLRLPAGTEIPVALLVVGVALWAFSLPQVDLRAMDDTGLVSALPITALVGLVVINGAFCLALRARLVSGRVLMGFVVVLVVVLYGATSILGDAPRGNVVWRHAGIIENLIRTGHPDPTIDAYFNWPGLFMFSASVSELAGFASPMAFARWAPVYLNLAFIGPLVMILRTATTDARVVWLAVWIFGLANWINQDYFAPQSATFFLFLVVVAIVLRWFGPDQIEGSARQRAVLMGVVVLLVAVTVPTHQLTPFAMLGAFLALVAVRRCRAIGLPVITAVLIAGWLSFMTVAYLKGNLADMVQQVGSLSGSASANVGQRVKGSDGHLLVVRLRLVMTAALWLLATLGAARTFSDRRRTLSFAVLAAAPFPLVALQPYGGEMIMRVYLLSLPFVVYFAARLFLPRPSPILGWKSTGAIALASSALLAGFLFSRFGNERIDQYTTDEVAAVARLYELAPPDALLVAGSGNLPWKYQDYERHDYLELTTLWDETPVPEQVVEEAWRAMDDEDSSFLIFTRSQLAYTDLLGEMPLGSLAQIEQLVSTSPSFEQVYSSEDASIFVPLESPSASVAVASTR